MIDDPCFDMVQHKVDEASWKGFMRGLPHAYKGIPSQWKLSAEEQVRLLLKLQYFHFNPDSRERLAEKRSCAWAFVNAFLGSTFSRKFMFLRSRHRDETLEKWDREFSQFENLLYLSSMDEALREQWVANFDSKFRHGSSTRVKIIKTKGLGLSCDVLEVTILMTWQEIKARYRYLLKRHHPDVGGDIDQTQKIIAAYTALEQQASRKGLL